MRAMNRSKFEALLHISKNRRKKKDKPTKQFYSELRK